MLPGKGLCFGFLCVCFAVKHVLGLVVFFLANNNKTNICFLCVCFAVKRLWALLLCLALVANSKKQLAHKNTTQIALSVCL